MAFKRDISILLESMRATTLGIHSAAGLCTQTRSGCSVKETASKDVLARACRLLRIAEASARNAVALVLALEKTEKEKDAKDVAPAAAAAQGNAASRASRSKKRRQKRSLKKKASVDETKMEYESDLAGAAPVGPAIGALAGLKDVLEGFMDRQVATSSTQLNPLAAVHLPIGTKVEIVGLATRSDLDGQFGVVTAGVTASGRYAVAIDGTKESVLIKADNLKLVLTSLNTWPG